MITVMLKYLAIIVVKILTVRPLNKVISEQ